MTLLPPYFLCGATDLRCIGIFLAKLRLVAASIALVFLTGRSLEIVPKYPVVENTMDQISPQWIWPWVFCVNEIITSTVQHWAIKEKSRSTLLFSGLAWNCSLATTLLLMWMLMFTLTVHVATYDKMRLMAFLLMVDIFIMLRFAMAIYELFIYRALYMKWKYETMSDPETASISSAEDVGPNNFPPSDESVRPNRF